MDHVRSDAEIQVMKDSTQTLEVRMQTRDSSCAPQHTYQCTWKLDAQSCGEFSKALIEAIQKQSCSPKVGQGPWHLIKLL